MPAVSSLAAKSTGSGAVELTTQLEIDRFMPAEVVGGSSPRTLVQLLEVKSSSSGAPRRAGRPGPRCRSVPTFLLAIALQRFA
jgi:hypothetical protein